MDVTEPAKTETPVLMATDSASTSGSCSGSAFSFPHVTEYPLARFGSTSAFLLRLNTSIQNDTHMALPRIMSTQSSACCTPDTRLSGSVVSPVLVSAETTRKRPST